MLKVATVSWRGRCSQHPAYDPSDNGAPGACSRCNGLFEIYQQHRRLVELMRQYGPMRERTPEAAPDRQGRLF